MAILRCTAELKAAIVEQYDKGMVGPAIASLLGLGCTTVYRVLASFDRKPQARLTALRAVKRAERAARPYRNRGGQPRSFTDEQANLMQQRWLQGLSQTAIAREIGCAQVTIGRCLKIQGIQTTRRRAEGARHGQWKGGRTISSGGYIAIRVPTDSPYRGMANREGYIFEHRLVMAQKLGRPLSLQETIHHKNGDKADNRLENLELRVGRHGTGSSAPHCPTCTCFNGDN